MVPTGSQVKRAWKVSRSKGPYKLNITKYEYIAELDVFKRTIGLTEAEEDEFKATSFDSLLDFIRILQQEQEQNGRLMYMKRLEPFLVSMKEYVEVVKDADVFVNISDIISYVWVSDSAHPLGKLHKQMGSQVVVGSDEIYSQGK